MILYDLFTNGQLVRSMTLSAESTWATSAIRTEVDFRLIKDFSQKQISCTYDFMPKADIIQIIAHELNCKAYELNGLYNSTIQEYDPIENYRMTESGSDTATSSASGTNTGEVTTYNSTGFKDDNRNTSSSSGNSATTHTLTRSGNIGVTTSQQMIQSERDLVQFDFIGHVCEIINNAVCISYYDVEDCEYETSGGGSGGTTDYNDLSNKPKINGVTLSGNVPASDLNIDYTDIKNTPVAPTGTTNYNALENRPQINGHTLTGNQSADDLELFDGNYNNLTNKPALFSGKYTDLTDVPEEFPPATHYHSQYADAINGKAAVISDDTEASTKTVPAGVRYAAPKIIYGKTVKDGETLKSAPIESVVSLSRNLYNPSDVNTTSGIIYTSGNDLIIVTRTSAHILDFSLPVSGYTFRANVENTTGTASTIRIYYTDGTYETFNLPTGSNAVSVTTNSSKTLSYLRNNENGLTKAIILKDFEIIKSEYSSLPYSPYNKTTISVPDSIKNLPDYGCSACDSYNYIDFENGIYHHKVGSVDMGTLTWTCVAIADHQTMRATIADAYKQPGNKLGNLMCSKYTNDTGNNVYNHVQDYTISLGASNNGLVVYDSNYISDAKVAEFKTSVTGVIVNYELATPEVIDISDIIRPIKCETGGTITLVNEHNLDVANTIIYEREVL